MDMHIDANSRLLKSDGDDQIGGLSSNSWEGYQLVDGIRDPASVFIDQLMANLMNRFGLRSVESDRIDRPFDLFQGQLQY